MNLLGPSIAGIRGFGPVNLLANWIGRWLLLGLLLLGTNAGAAPANDMFADRIVLSGSPLSITGSNAGATRETGELPHANYFANYSVWWSWTASARQAVILDSTGTAFTPIIAVYTGESVSSLTSVTYNIPYVPTPGVAFLSNPGTAYQIAVDVYSGIAGSINLQLMTLPEPVNDSFANRVPLAGATNVITASNVGCSRETGEPPHAGFTGGRSVWWSWTAPADGTVVIDTTGSQLRTLIGVYQGTDVSNLTLVARSAASAVKAPNRVVFRAVAGGEYAIAVDDPTPYSGLIQLAILQASGAPEIITSPQSQIVGRADPVLFSPVLAGAEPMSFEWRFQGNVLPDATQQSLALSSVLEAQEGVYQFVARNGFGAVTSSPFTVSLATNTVQITNAGSEVLEGDRITLTLSRNGFTNALQVRYATEGTAVTGADYSTLPGVVSFGPGQTTATITITTIDDAIEEPPRSIRLSLLPDEHYAIGSPGFVDLTQTDDDPNIRVWVGDGLVREVGPDPGSFILRRTGDVSLPLRALCTVTGSARPGLDYEPLPTVVELAAGASEAVIVVHPLRSGTPGDRGITLTVAPDAAYRVRPPGKASITILANRGPWTALVAPKTWQTASEGQPVTLVAVADDADGTVGRVEFLDGLRPLGNVTAPPYQWTGSLPRGLHMLSTRAHDNLGAVGESTPVNLLVLGAAEGPALTQLALQAPSTPGLPDSASGDSLSPAMSRDGQLVAFVSQAGDLSQKGPYRTSLGNTLQVYAADPPSGTLTLVSCNGNGSPAAGNAYGPVVSGAGNLVAFESPGDNLVAYDRNDASDVFVWDRTTGHVRLVSACEGSTDVAGNAESEGATISGSGRRVAFQSLASDLVAGDTNGLSDVFVRDLESGRTELVSVSASGTGGGSGNSESAVISDDGTHVAFLSRSTNLVAEATTLGGDILVRNLETRVTVSAGRDVAALLASLGSTNAARYRCYNPSLSANGRFVAFKAAATNYTGPVLVLLHNLETRMTTLVTTNASPPLNLLNDASLSTLSTDGQVLAYESTNLVYAWDARAGTSQLLSCGPDGLPPAAGRAWSPVLSRDGNVVSFYSDAPGLVPGAVPGLVHLYRQRLDTGEIVLVSVDKAGMPASFLENTPPVLSADGSAMAFASCHPGLVAQDSNGASDVFLFAGATNRLLSVRAPGSPMPSLPIEDDLAADRFSAEGRLVSVSSLAGGWTATDTNLLWDVIQFDIATGSRHLVSLNTNGVAARGASHSPAQSANGQIIAFASNAGDLTRGDSNARDDIFVRDLAAGVTILVSSNRLGTTTAQAVASSPVISDDGEWVGFVSTASDLVTFSNPGPDLFLRQWRTGSLVMVTNQFSNSSTKTILPLRIGTSTNVVYLHSGSSGMQLFASNPFTRSNFFAGPVLSRPFVTRDGRFAASRLKATGFPPVILDCLTGRTVSIPTQAVTGLTFTNLGAADVVMSENGQRMAFVSAYDLVPATDSNLTNDIYIVDIGRPGVRLGSLDFWGVSSGNAPSGKPMLSPDGRFLAFRSRASNLVPGRVAGESVYVRDLDAGIVWLVAGVNPGPGIGAQGWAPGFVPGGLRVLFSSLSGDIAGSAVVPQAPVLLLGLEKAPTQDQDGDGMDDDWEMLQFGNLLADGAADSDKDGLTDLQEFWAGTDPRRSESMLAIAFIQKDNEGLVHIQWPAVAGRSYRVEAADALEPGRWTVIASDVRPSAQVGSFEEQPGEVQHRFYRVMVNP